MSRRLMSAAVFAVASVVAASSQPAHADVTRAVISAFHGQLVVTKDELPEGKNDRDTIKQIKAAQLKEVVGTSNGETTSWTFHYTAFLSRTGATSLRFQFLKGKQLSADKGLGGIDPKSKVLSGDISMSEDEGLNKGTSYVVELVNGNKVVAKTKLTMK